MSAKSSPFGAARQIPNSAAISFYREVAKLPFMLEGATYRGENLPDVRMQIDRLCVEYQRNRGNGIVGPLTRAADGICQRLQKIGSFNPVDWTSRRRGQQFRRLNEELARFSRMMRNG